MLLLTNTSVCKQNLSGLQILPERVMLGTALLCIIRVEEWPNDTLWRAVETGGDQSSINPKYRLHRVTRYLPVGTTCLNCRKPSSLPPRRFIAAPLLYGTCQLNSLSRLHFLWLMQFTVCLIEHQMLTTSVSPPVAWIKIKRSSY